MPWICLKSAKKSLFLPIFRPKSPNFALFWSIFLDFTLFYAIFSWSPAYYARFVPNLAYFYLFSPIFSYFSIILIDFSWWSHFNNLVQKIIRRHICGPFGPYIFSRYLDPKKLKIKKAPQIAWNWAESAWFCLKLPEISLFLAILALKWPNFA